MGQSHAGLFHRDEQRHLALGIGQAGRSGDEADLAPHGLHHQHRVGRAGASVLLVGVLHIKRPIPSYAPITRRVVDELELGVAHVVVDRLGYAHSDQVETPVGGQLGDLVGCIHTIIATVVEKVAHVVGLEHLDDALKVFLLTCSELVAARADGTRSRRCAEQSDLFIALRGQIEQLFLQHPFDSMITGV